MSLTKEQQGELIIFIEALLTSELLRDDILQSYFQSIIFKDIIERYNIKEVKKLHDDNYKREINGLKEALKAYNLKQGIIVTYDLKDEKKIDGMTIKIVPVWEWLLG